MPRAFPILALLRRDKAIGDVTVEVNDSVLRLLQYITLTLPGFLEKICGKKRVAVIYLRGFLDCVILQTRKTK